MDHKIILTRGIPGSGKTYYANQWVVQDPEHRIRINNDDIRNMLGPYWITSREVLVNHIRRTSITAAIQRGYSIILDNTNLSTKYINEVYNILRENGCSDIYDVEYRNFPTPIEECIKRDAIRERPIGEKVIRDMYERAKSLIYI